MWVVDGPFYGPFIRVPYYNGTQKDRPSFGELPMSGLGFGCSGCLSNPKAPTLKPQTLSPTH